MSCLDMSWEEIQEAAREDAERETAKAVAAGKIVDPQ